MLRKVSCGSDGMRRYCDNNEHYADTESVCTCCGPCLQLYKEDNGVSDKMKMISSVVESTSASADKAAEISERLESESGALKKLVAKFTLV